MATPSTTYTPDNTLGLGVTAKIYFQGGIDRILFSDGYEILFSNHNPTGIYTADTTQATVYTADTTQSTSYTED